VKRLSGSFLLAAALLSGCGGGGGDSAAPASGTLNFNGSETLAGQLTNDTTVPAAGGVVAATDRGQVVIPSGSVPGGTNLPASTAVAIIPQGVGFTGEFNLGASLTVNGVSNSGAGIGSNGRTSQAVGLPVPAGLEGISHSVSFPSGKLDTRDLTVQRFVLAGRYYIRTNPFRIISPFPTALSGRIPNNGESATGSDVTALFGPDNDGRSATLSIDYGTGFILSRTKVIANSRARFSDFTDDGHAIPSSGVVEVKLQVGDLP
jgi:hypothetical protein